MAATKQRHQSLQQFILAGEAELANLEEPARTLRAQSLFEELQRRFKTTEPVDIDGFTEPPSDMGLTLILKEIIYIYIYTYIQKDNP
jgi:hypothetical protein